MVDYENTVITLRLSRLRRIFDDSYDSFWKLYLNDLLSSHGGFFLLKCNYDFGKLNTNLIIIIMNFYHDAQN